MGKNLQEIILLLWKNLLVQRRHPLLTAFEIGMPVAFVGWLALGGSDQKMEERDIRMFPEFSPNILPGGENISTYNFLWSPCGNVALQAIMQAAIGQHRPMFTKNCVDNASELQRQMLMNANNIWAGIQFDDELASNGSIGKEIRIVLRYPAELRITNESSLTTWPTHLLFPLYQVPGPRDEVNDFGAIPNYYLETFLMLQEALSTAVIHYHMEDAQFSQADMMLPRITMQRFPYPSWITDTLLENLKSHISLEIVFGFDWTCTYMVQLITKEKQTQLREIMKIMGLPNWLHCTAWFLMNFVLLLIPVVLVVVLLIYYVITYTNVFVLFVFMLFYMFASITFCFAISAFFSRGDIASITAFLVGFVTYGPYYFLKDQYSNLNLSSKLANMLGFNSAVGYGFHLIIMFERTGKGIQWNTIFSTNPGDNLTLAHVILMLIIDTIIYLIVALYVESVIPRKYGVPQPWYFPFTYAYWCGHIRYSDVKDEAADRIEESNIYEREPANLKAGIKIKHLKKMFGNKQAVKDMSLNIFEGQITALLGHNGAGRSTIVSMLTGMLPPTSGTAIINGYDIRTGMNRIRDSLSVCPQDNIFFDELTVKEHLYFFTKLKGVTDKKKINAEITKYAELFELVSKINARPKKLSGGMKRKLCVGIALCGNSRVCMFDEPTAGIDSAAKRSFWDLMQQEKKDRTVVLSTHLMDEADVIGDRIAIMAGGRLESCGTSSFLKKKYGADYHLVLEKMPKCDVSTVTNMLKRHIPSIQVENDVGSELTYSLPKEQSTSFQKMLEDLETRAREVGVANFGISLPTMEDVFMKVDTESGQEENDTLENTRGGTKMPPEGGYKHSSDAMPNVKDLSIVKGFQLKMNQFRAMMMKKVLSTTRYWTLVFAQNMIPVGAIILFFLALRSTPSDLEAVRLDLSLKAYHDPIITFSTSNLTNAYYLQYRKTLINEGQEFVDWKLEDFVTNLLELVSYMLNVLLVLERCLEGKQDIATIKMKYLFGVVFKEDRIVTLFNNEPYHSPPLALEYTMNTILQVKMKSEDYRIRFSNHPLPLNSQLQSEGILSTDSVGFLLGLFIGCSLILVSPFYVLFYIRERVSKSKHLQFVSGVGVSIYWITAYLWDFLTFLFTSVCIIITLACFQEGGFTTVDELGRVFVLLILYIFAVLPEMYLWSYVFENTSSGVNCISTFSFFFGMVPFIAVKLLRGLEKSNLKGFANSLHWVFLLEPHFAVVSGIEDMYMKYFINSMCATYDEVYGDSDIHCEAIPSCCGRNEYFFGRDSYGIGRNITFLIITATILTVLLMLIEFRVFERIGYMFKKHIARTPPTNDEDDIDVLEEKRRVKEGEINKNEYSIVLKDVTKKYGNFLAVNQLCLGIKGGECFGLLGVNGAGKTTVFRIMTGDISVSNGDVWIYGLNAKTDMRTVRKHIGYCPQFDAFLDELTGKETLIMYCLLRGISFKESKFVAHNLAREFDFRKHLNKKIREYSGGNKRKLSAAVACIGYPPIIFLDEPTTGMDPATKHKVWDFLCRLRDSGKCLVLTTHNMQECEVLCTRLSIMVNGSLKCLGTIQHLKNRFSQGYTLTIRIKIPDPDSVLKDSDVEIIETFVKRNFPSAILRGSYQQLLIFYIPDTAGLKWSKMFAAMEDARKSLNIEDYSLSQSSLEEVFLYFAKFQREESP